MVQPKTPPLSIRPGDVRLAKIDAYATRHGIKRHAAVLELIDVGLDGLFAVATRRPTPKPRLQPISNRPDEAERASAPALQLGPTRPKPGGLLKGAKK